VTKPDDRDRYIVPALERGLRLLRSLTRERPALSLGEIAEINGLPRATAFRLVRTLESLGYLRRTEGGKSYRLGPAVLSLGFEYLASVDLPEIARPALEELRDRTGASAHLAIRDRDEIVYLCRVPGRSALTSNIRVGTKLDAHASSMGRALLADLPADELASLYADNKFRRFTDQTPANLEELRALLGEDARRGYVVSRAFHEPGVVSVAAAVRDTTGAAVAAINVTAAENSIAAGALEGAIKDDVVEAANTISSWLGAVTRAAAE
jgi:DNA-binding IclR family transcriptional regulator